MVRTQTIDTPDELIEQERKAIEKRDRFILGASQAHKRLTPKRVKKRLASQSLFSFLAPIWQSLTPSEKQAWADAGAFSALTNWQLFVSDNAARLRTGLPLDQPPSDLWQVRAGRIVIESPADQITLKQDHPQEYWAAVPVSGQPWKDELVVIKEQFALPLDLEIRYKSNLSAVGGTQKAQYLARVWSSYQGVDRFTDEVIDLNPSTDWTKATATISAVIGHTIGYTLYIDIAGYQGELMYDNIRAIHGGTNWARDPRCDDVDKTFKKAFAVVPPFWVPVNVPDGASFASEFPPSL